MIFITQCVVWNSLLSLILASDLTDTSFRSRFGYLTKYADLIIYMDKGRAVEQGSHEELLALNGQYANLYNVQAQAFI